MRFIPILIGRLLLTFALLCAIMASGFAHTVSRTNVPQELSDYIALGGAVADICGEADNSTGASGAKCEACRLIGAAVLPPATCQNAYRLRDTSVKLRFVATQFRYSQSLDPARLSRAPPQV